MKDIEQLRQELKESAELFKLCLETAVEVIPPERTTALEPFGNEDYRQIAASLFIQHHKGHSYPQPKGKSKEPQRSTENQQNYIGDLLIKAGKKGDAIVDQFLENNEVERIDELSRHQATTLINLLKEGMHGPSKDRKQ